MVESTAYTLVFDNGQADRPSNDELKRMIKDGRDDTKIEAMKQVLVAVLNGESMPDMLMPVIQGVLTSRNKQLKKLCSFYWEACTKRGSDGKLKQEMILACNALRNDLQHPNEYIRGATLRLLCKLKEPELLEPLIASVRACLDHRHAYVRKNAALAVARIAINTGARSNGDNNNNNGGEEEIEDHHSLIPDAVEILSVFLANESDAVCKRNAFVGLAQLSRNGALGYIQQNAANMGNLDELLQLAFIEFMRKDAIAHQDLKPVYLRLVTELLDTQPSATVAYDAASALTVFSASDAAVQAAASKFLDIASKESDNNIKLIVLDTVDQLHKSTGALSDVVMDVLMVLSSPDLDVRKKALKLALSMITSKNVDDVIRLLKRELSKAVSGDSQLPSGEDKAGDYRQTLIKAIHSCAVRFSEIAADAVDLLLSFLSELNSAAAVEVISFVKEVVELYPDLRSAVIKKLLTVLKQVKSGKVYRSILWVVGEYCIEEDEIQSVWVSIRKSFGDVPIRSDAEIEEEEQEQEEESTENGGDTSQVNGTVSKTKSQPRVLADGTYASESAITAKPVKSKKESGVGAHPLRTFLFDGQWFVMAVLAGTLVKLALRYCQKTNDVAHKNALKAEGMLILTSILRVGQSDSVKIKIDEDAYDRIYLCLRAIAEETPIVDQAFLEDTHDVFRKLVVAQQKVKDAKTASEKARNATQADAPVRFRQLSRGESQVATVSAAATGSSGSVAGAMVSKKPESRLRRIVQLTGFSDPVYAEAFMDVHQFDIVFEVLLFNQTTETLQNLTVEFATLGELKVVERPVAANVAAQSFHTARATIKVSSADAGVIFGNIVYEQGKGGQGGHVVILNEVHVDIMDYIKPGSCSEAEFRSMWSEFEWENKVNISFKYPTLRGFLQYLLKNTNMKCLTSGILDDDRQSNGSEEAELDDCQFLSANLHARSLFGDDALANLSIEKDGDGKITGHVRIRSKGQGLALALGDRVADIQRKGSQLV